MRHLDTPDLSGYIKSPAGGSLRVRLREVEEVVSLTGEVTFGMEDIEGINATEPVFYELVLRREGEGFSLKGPLRFSLGLTCSRCLKSFKESFESFIDLRLLAEQDIWEEELELTSEETGVAFFKGEEVDLAPLIWEEMMLCVPIKPLCMEDCKGICPYCGKDRNLEGCTCGDQKESALGEKLKEFLNR
jgi:uncharacterized protein